MYKYDITGQQFGYLKVIERDYSVKGGKDSKWICKCNCGNVTSVRRNFLTGGQTKSCGCLAKEVKTKHGMGHTRIYAIWSKMKVRCDSDARGVYEYYKAKGVTVCDEWKEDFMSFYNWSIANGYKDDLTIDRIDVNGNYSPENCRWATRKQQARNRTKHVHVIYNGEDYILSALCEEIGFPYKTAYKRWYRLRDKGLPIDVNYLFAPIDKRRISKKYRKD